MGSSRVCAVMMLVVAPASAAADGFAEVAAGPVVTRRAEASEQYGPKLAVRLGTMGRRRLDEVLSIDWTPIESAEAGTSEHRIRALASLLFDGQVGVLIPRLRVGGGLEFLRASRPSGSYTSTGYAFEIGAGLWYGAGSTQVGGDIGMSFGIADAPTSDEARDMYTSRDVDLTIGVRSVLR